MKFPPVTLAAAILAALWSAVAVAQNPAKPHIFIADADGKNVKLLVPGQNLKQQEDQTDDRL